MQLVDIGLNLAHPRFQEDLDQVVARARAAGVVAAVLTGTSVPDSAAVAALARRFPGWAFPTAGVHPHQADTLDPSGLDRLRALAAAPGCVAVGECGLDFERDFSPRPAQEAAFEAQLALAAELGRPVFLHQRGAWGRFAAILGPWIPRLPAAVLHCFTEAPDRARAALDLGCKLGITGWICDERRGGPLREAVAALPLDRLMIETDAPYLSPRDITAQAVPGLSRARLLRRNEPAALPWICEAVAHCGGWTPAAVAEASTATARRVFGLG